MKSLLLIEVYNIQVGFLNRKAVSVYDFTHLIFISCIFDDFNANSIIVIHLRRIINISSLCKSALVVKSILNYS